MRNLLNKKTTNLLRIKQIVAPHGPIPVSRSTWYEWIRLGQVPKPIKLGKRISVWRSEDIQKRINESKFSIEADAFDKIDNYPSDFLSGGKSDV